MTDNIKENVCLHFLVVYLDNYSIALKLCIFYQAGPPTIFERRMYTYQILNLRLEIS